jgi:hypothetical protein
MLHSQRLKGAQALVMASPGLIGSKIKVKVQINGVG